MAFESATFGASEVHDFLCDFLEKAVHFILYNRQVYSPYLFDVAKWHEMRVHICRHPDLIQYVRELVKQIKPWIQKGMLEQFVLMITTAEHTPLERWSIKVNTSNLTKPGARVDRSWLAKGCASFLVAMSTYSDLEVLPDKATFSVLAYVKDNADVTTIMGEQERHNWEDVKGSNDIMPKNATATPMRTIKNEHLVMNLVLETCSQSNDTQL